MRKRTLGVVLLAGLAISGGGAFTATNNVTAIDGGTKNIAGYGQSTSTGATVTSIKYATLVTDASKLASVTWRASEDLTGKTGKVTLRDSAGAPLAGGVYSCVVTFNAVSATNLTAYSEGVCDTANNPAIASYVGVGITVTN